MHLFTRLLILSLLLLLGACASVDKKQEWSAQQYYREAKTALDNRDYETAIRYYEELKSAYPYGRYAEQADLDIIYAYYKGGEPESAIAAADNFIKQYPRHPNVDYAYYLRGLASFSEGDTFLNKTFNQDPTQRDPSHLRRSFNYFSELVRKFPESKYRADALQRMNPRRGGGPGYHVSSVRQDGAYRAGQRCTTGIAAQFSGLSQPRPETVTENGYVGFFRNRPPPPLHPQVPE